LRITFLGSGAAFCDHRVNYHNNALVQTAEGPVMLDCGLTACQSLRELSVPASQVRAVLFTHLHADHASPEQLAWERYYRRGAGEPVCQRTPLVAPTDVVMPLLKSLHHFMDEYTARDGVVHRGGVNAIFEPTCATEVEIGGVRFRWFRVEHVAGPGVDKPAYGVEIDDGESRVIWSGDTRFSPRWLRRVAGDPQVVGVFHECTFQPPFQGTVHTHFEELSGLEPDLLGQITLMHHTEVPAGTDIGAFSGAAARHQVFEL